MMNAWLCINESYTHAFLLRIKYQVYTYVSRPKQLGRAQ